MPRDPPARLRQRAELAQALGIDPLEAEERVVLTSPVPPGISGLDTLTVLERAVGVLIAEGHDARTAEAALLRLAQETSSSLTDAAHAVLRRTRDPRSDTTHQTAMTDDDSGVG